MISLETSQWKWASSRLKGRISFIFSSCGRCSRLTTGTSGTRSVGLRKDQFPCELLEGLSGFLTGRCRGPRPCVEWGPEPEYSSPVLTWILGYFWSLPRGVMKGRISFIFSSCGRCSRLTMGTSGTRSGGLKKGQSPWELLWGLSGFLSHRCWGLRPCVASVLEPEVSSSVLTWILGYFWSLPRGVSPRLEWGHARAVSSRAVAAVSRYPSR